MKQSTKGSKRNTSLKGADLSGYDLTGANLRGADLTNANLGFVDLSGANLEYVSLENADLRHSNLNDADLRYAKLGGAKLNNAKLQYADLSNAYLLGANLNGADLIYAQLQGADLSGAKMKNANMSGVKKAEQSSSKNSIQDVLDGYRAANKGSLMILTPILVGLGLVEIYKRVSDKSDVSAAEVADNSETSEPFDRMPGATQIVDNMVQRRKANNVLFEKNAPTLWPSGGLTVVNMIDAIQRGDNLPEFPTTKI